MNTNANINAGLNPLDRNHDGQVNARDLLPGAGNQAGVAHHNPLDRNHDGRVDGRDILPGAGLNSGIATNAGVATKLETIQKETVVHEHIHPVQKEEIQPIIYREREQLDVKQVTQMMHETQIQPTMVQQRELAAEVRAPIVERSAPIAENYVAPSREVDATTRTQVVHAPIVNEVIKKTIVEEIQPVLERDIITSTVIQNTQPIFEKHIEAPRVIREVRTAEDRGIIGGDLNALRAQGFNVDGFNGASTGMVGTGLAHHNPLDRNHDGRVNAQDLLPGAGQTGLNSGLGMNSGLGAGAHHNPLDRNHDGRVNTQDLLPGAGQTGLNSGLGMNSGLGVNPLDRNHDGRVDARDMLPGAGQTGLNSGLGMNSGLGVNPLDRNHDGRVDARDMLPGAGLNSGIAGNSMLGGETLLTHHGLTNAGQSGIAHNPLDRNHDGKVGLADLTGRPATTSANAAVRPF